MVRLFLADGGGVLMEAGEKLSHVHIGVLAGQGLTHAPVRARLRAAVLSTGDEILPVGRPLSPGKIYNSNLPMLRARLEELGAEVTVSRSLPDHPEAVAEALQKEASPAWPPIQVFVNQAEEDTAMAAARRLAECLPWPVYAGALKRRNWTCLS